jgi:hypothetical protein
MRQHGGGGQPTMGKINMQVVLKVMWLRLG